MAACSESFLGIETSGLIYCEDEPISFTDLLDRSTGKVMIFTLFETEADMQAGMSSGLVQQQLAKLAPL